MNEKYGFIINSLQKDFEVSSWNEQGEIIRIEGILTIAFLFISPCSHKDNGKQLYLIIRIPYSVNMSLADNEKYHIPRNIKIVDGFPGEEEKEQKIKKLEEDNLILKKEIEQLKTELEKIKHENHVLKMLNEIVGVQKSDWLIRRDLAIRTNAVSDEPNEFGFPLDFNEDNVHNLHSHKNKSTWCHFRYYFEGKYPDGQFWEYDMPWSLYGFLVEQREKKIKELMKDFEEGKESTKKLMDELKQKKEDINNRNQRIYRQPSGRILFELAKNKGFWDNCFPSSGGRDEKNKASGQENYSF